MVDLLLCAFGIAVVLGIIIVAQNSRMEKVKGDKWQAELERDKALKGKATAQNQARILQDRCKVFLRQLDNSFGNTRQALEVAKTIELVRGELRELTDFVVYPLDTGSGDHRKALPEQAGRVLDAPPPPPAPAVAEPAVQYADLYGEDAEVYGQDADRYGAEAAAPPIAPPGPWPVVRYANPYADPNVVPHQHAEHQERTPPPTMDGGFRPPPAKARRHPYQNDLPYPDQERTHAAGFGSLQNASTVSISGGTYHYTTDKETRHD